MMIFIFLTYFVSSSVIFQSDARNPRTEVCSDGCLIIGLLVFQMGVMQGVPKQIASFHRSSNMHMLHACPCTTCSARSTRLST